VDYTMYSRNSCASVYT